MGDVEKTHADISKARKELGYYPQFSLEKGTKKCVKWCMETSNLFEKYSFN